jgi:hypothetical protein
VIHTQNARNPRPRARIYGENSRSSSPQDVLSRLYPVLLARARSLVADRELDASFAEDAVQEAVLRWLLVSPNRDPKRWLFRAMFFVVKEHGVRSHDPLDQRSTLSLDQPWAHG